MSSVFSPVSILLFTYNQEKYIRAAFESALRQEGFPIEIVVTDDHSTDRTFEIVQEMTKDYRGPHKIILNRNPKNLGIVPQVNRAVSLSSGELIVVMAGDDISLPTRAMRSYEEWCKSGKNAHSIFFNAFLIDEKGKLLNQKYILDAEIRGKNNLRLRHYKQFNWEIVPKENGSSIYNNWVLGATHSFSMEVFKKFGPLKKCMLSEDHAIPYRSILLGEVKFINETQVLYRRHNENYWPDNADSKKIRTIAEKEIVNYIITSNQAYADLKVAYQKRYLSYSLFKALKKQCAKNILSGLREIVKKISLPSIKQILHCGGDLFAILISLESAFLVLAKIKKTNP